MGRTRVTNVRRRADSRAIAEALEARRLLTTFALTSDIGESDALLQIRDMVVGWNPKFIAAAGDINNDHDTFFDDTVGKAYHDWIDPYIGAYGAGSTTGNKFWPAVGNHDYNGDSLDAWQSFFTLPNNERYYTVREDDVQLFMVNSNEQEPDGITVDSTQALWLKNELAASTAKWKLVMMHHPPYSSGWHGDTAEVQWPFEAWGASAVVTGHDHDYERVMKGSFPYFVIGLGGTPIREFSGLTNDSAVRYNADWGAMRVDTSTTSMKFQFFTRTGVLIDSYTVGSPIDNGITLVPHGSTWKYQDTGSPAATWQSLGFDDSGWSSGAAELGYGDGDEATLVSYGGDAAHKSITTYFRKTFTLADPSAISALAMRILRDDGAVVYLNGSEVYRTNMPTGTITSSTPASAAVEDTTLYSTTINPLLLQAGNNVIAVEIHQADETSSDISFDFELTASTAPVVPAPAAPAGLSANVVGSAQVDLSWQDNADNETGFILERSTDNVTFTQVATVAANRQSYSDTTGLTPGQKYYYRIRAINGASASPNSNVASATLMLPFPWLQADVGAVGVVGSATFASGTFALMGAGADIWGSADAFHFVYQSLSGDGEIVARVASVQNIIAGSHAGVMIRASLDASAAEASIVQTAGGGIGFVRRSATGGSSVVTTAAGDAPYWLKLTRAANTFTAYRSADGVTWSAIGSDTFSMGSTVYIGIVACSKSTTIAGSATFTNVSTTAVPPFAYMAGSTLNVQFDGTATPITLAASGANVIATQGATKLTFSGVVAINAIGTANSDALQLSGALTPTLSFANGNGADSVRVMSGSYTFGTDLSPSLRNVAVTIDAGAAATFNATQHLASLTVTGNATLAAGGAKVLVTKGLAVTGKLDLKDNDLVLDYTSVSPVGTWGGSTYGGVTGMIAAGRNGGAWNGNGIVTSSAATNLNTLGVAESSQVLGIAGTQTGIFSGETIDATAVLIKYTYGSDANLDGKLNVDDYTRIDFNIPLGIRGFYNGDFNLDGKINVDDYTIIDFNVGIQGPIL